MPEGQTRRPLTIVTVIVAVLALALPSAALAVSHHRPHGLTGGASHVLGSSALLQGTVYPEGQETAYYFQWGTTSAYGNQTATAVVPAGTTGKVQVGQLIVGLTAGATYHYRIVAGGGPGKDRVFSTKGSKLRFEIAKPGDVTVGRPFVLSGTLRGYGAAGRHVALQATAWPYTESFATIGLPGTTDASGRFAFRVANISRSTEFRVITLDPRPVFSSSVIVKAAPAVTLHVHTSSAPGVVRFYGTIAPSIAGARVYIQVEKAVKPNARTEATTHWVTQFLTPAKRGTSTVGRFSVIVTLHLKGRYRAFVKVPGGNAAYVSGSSNSIVLRQVAAGHRK